MKCKFFWFVFLLLSFIVTLPVTWWGLTKVDFFYATLHDQIDIDKHIQTYAPRNQFYKQGFEKTTKQQRVDLFQEVVNAIHNDGRGLENLSFLNNDQKKTALFTGAEITHLKDVANLLNKLKPILLLIVVIWLLFLLWVFLKRMRLPSIKQYAVMSLLWLAFTVFILLLGPEKVFNQLHIWAFPKNHQWFFYYEESLMSTMMKAPDLFGYISVIWAILSLMLTILLLKSMHLILLKQRY